MDQKKRQWLSLRSGVLSYACLYRSNIDIPFLEKNIAQHQTFALPGFTLFNLIPFQINAYLRRSNSRMFQDIADVQVQFNANSYRSLVEQNFKQRLYNYLQALKDTITEKDYLIAKGRLTKLSALIRDRQVSQKLIEVNEVVNITEITYDKSLPDRILSPFLFFRFRIFISW